MAGLTGAGAGVDVSKVLSAECIKKCPNTAEAIEAGEVVKPAGVSHPADIIGAISEGEKKMAVLATHKSMTFVGEEFLGTLKADTDRDPWGSSGNGRSFVINPGNDGMFPKLKAFSRSFQKYMITGLNIRLKSYVGDDSDNLSVGRVGFLCQDNTYRGNPAFAELFGEGGHSFAVGPSKLIPCTEILKNAVVRYIRDGDNEKTANGNVRDVEEIDSGKIWIMTRNCPQADELLYELYLSYSVTFLEPKDPIAGDYAIFETEDRSATTTNLLGLNDDEGHSTRDGATGRALPISGNLGCWLDYNGTDTLLYMPPWMSKGKFVVSIAVAGASMTSANLDDIDTASTNCALSTLFDGGTDEAFWHPNGEAAVTDNSGATSATRIAFSFCIAISDQDAIVGLSASNATIANVTSCRLMVIRIDDDASIPAE